MRKTSILRDLFKGKSQNPSDPSQATNQEFNEDYTEFVNNEYSRRQAERRSFELQWRLNSEFINGNQYLDINPVSSTIEEIPRLNWHEVREVFNQLATICESRISKMGRQKPMMKTRPGSSDDVDISSAKVTSMLLNSTWHDQRMDENYEEVVSWLEFTGTVFIKTSWDKNKGRLIYSGPDPTNQPAPKPLNTTDDNHDPDANPDKEQSQQPKNVEIREGDLDTSVVPAYEIFPDSSYRKNMRDCRSIIHAKAYHIEEVLELYGQQVEAEEVDVITLQRTASTMGGGLGHGISGVRSKTSTIKNHVVVKEYYERRTSRFPQGRFIVVAGKKTLFAGPLPYMIGDNGEPDFPLTRICSISTPGCFWGKTIVERCLSVQRRYNALRNRKAEYLNLVTIGQWYVPQGSIDEGIELNNAPGNIIYYRPGVNGAKPEPVVYPNLPNSFEMEEHTLLSEFTAISGVSELSRFAEAPSGVKSGVALGVAKEQDDTRIATSVSHVANGMIDVGKKWIRMYRQLVQEPRLLRQIGANREADVREWQKSDLRSDDVFIENMSALSETPAQRRQMVFDLMAAGLFNRPELSQMTEEGRQKVFQLLEFGHWETGHEDDLYIQKSRARRENRDIMEGQPIPVMDFDDHMLHIQVHNRQRMQADFDELLQTPNGMMVNQIMMAHIAEHIQLAIAAMPKEPVEEETKPKPKGGKASGNKK